MTLRDKMRRIFEPYLRNQPEPPQKPSKTLQKGDKIAGWSESIHRMSLPDEYFMMKEAQDGDETDEDYLDEFGALPLVIGGDNHFKNLPPLSLKDVQIECFVDPDGHFSITLQAATEMENPNYKEQMKTYESRLSFYEKDIQDWTEEKLVYNQDLAEYRKQKLAELEEEKKRLESSIELDKLKT